MLFIFLLNIYLFFYFFQYPFYSVPITDEVFLQVLNKTETTPKDSKESKRIDSIQKIIYDRIAAFEKDPEIRRKFMATAYEADITDLVIYILCIKISIIVHLPSYFF